MNTTSKEIFRSLLAVVLAITHAAIATYVALPFFKPLVQWIFSLALSLSICNTQNDMEFLLAGILAIATTVVAVAIYALIAAKIMFTVEKYILILVWGFGDAARKYLNRPNTGQQNETIGR